MQTSKLLQYLICNFYHLDLLLQRKIIYITLHHLFSELTEHGHKFLIRIQSSTDGSHRRAIIVIKIYTTRFDLFQNIQCPN